MPPFIVDLTTTDSSGNTIPLDLTNATTIKVIGWRNNAALFSRTVTPTSGERTAGTVTMNWQAADTSVAADLYLVVEITWVTGKPQTIPGGDDYFVVRVAQDLT